ncbi:unnamed protein product [Phaeothamnion confervicola]
MAPQSRFRPAAAAVATAAATVLLGATALFLGGRGAKSNVSAATVPYPLRRNAAAAAAVAPSSGLCGDGSCENAYIDELSEIRESWGARVKSFMCSYAVRNAPTFGDMLFLFPSPGTTGSRSMSSFLGETCGWNVFHYASFFFGRDEDEIWRSTRRGADDNWADPNWTGAGLMAPEAEALNLIDGKSDEFLDSHAILPDLIPRGHDKPVDAVLDDPMCQLFFDTFHQFPNARFVLLHRDPVDWAESRRRKHRRAPLPVIRGATSDCVTDASLDELAGAFAAFEAYVRCKVPPERLLEVDYFAEIPQADWWAENVTAGAVAEAQVAAFAAAAGRPCLRYAPSEAVSEAAGIRVVPPTNAGGDIAAEAAAADGGSTAAGGGGGGGGGGAVVDGVPVPGTLRRRQ